MYKRHLATLLLAATPLLAAAQSAPYPSKPIRIIVGLAPGGPTDLFGRMFAEHLQTKYKQTVVVENRPGAGQIIGADAVAKSAPDGYTLLSGSSNLVYESLLNREAPLDTTRDLVPVGVYSATGLFFAVHSSVPAKTMTELVTWMKANPGKLTYGTTGTPLVPMESFRDRLGLSWVTVPYKGGPAAFQALLTGEVQLYTPDVNQGNEPNKAGKIRLLAYTDRVRHPSIPDVPTVAESGVGMPDFGYQVWLGVYAPSKTPEDVIARINAEVNEMNRGPTATQRYSAQGWVPVFASPAELRRNAQRDTEEVRALLAKGVKLR